MMLSLVTTAVVAWAAVAAPVKEYDLVVYGGTSAGVIAAVQAKIMGKSVVLVCPDKHLGGLSSGGLGWTDTGNKAVIGGLARDFYHRVWQHYDRPEAWKWQQQTEYGNRGQGTPAIDGQQRTMWIFEPHVAEQIFEDYLRESGIPVHRDQWLDRADGVKKLGPRIVSITMLSGQAYAGRMFIDATYEGDLMAAANVKYAVGREAQNVYREPAGGVQTGILHHRHHFGVLKQKISPYVVPGDPASGALPRISTAPPGAFGEGDRRVQAYCFRMCLTDKPENRIPFAKPAGYDPRQYELLLRIFDAGWRETFDKFDPIPNHKTDTNNHGPFSTDNIGYNYDYPEASYQRRREIVREHETYQQGWLYFIANDPRVPQDVQRAMQRWGLPKDEFQDHGGWSHQLYIREARRMVGSYVMTENELLKQRPTPQPVGMGSYTIDSHNVQRYITPEGDVQNEGDVGVATRGPYEIAYGSLVPQRGQADNLLVPVCVSSSHIAFGSIRMEPVFMILGQSAATAACLALDAAVPVQDVDYAKLRTRLLADKQVLEWTPPAKVAAVKPIATQLEDPALKAPPVDTQPGPEYGDNTRPFQGIPGIERAAGGRLWATWYAGGPGEGGANYVVLVTSADDGRTWSGPQLVIDPPELVRAYDPCLWRDPQNRLWLFWAQSHNWWDGRSGVWAIVTDNPDDERPRWSKPRRLSDGIMMNKPTVLGSGEWLMPAAIWERKFTTDAAHGHDPASQSGANVMISRDRGTTWTFRGRAIVPGRVFDEHSIIERRDGSLWMLVRANYGIGESLSTDRGQTWSAGRQAAIPHVNSRFFICRLRSGKLLLVTHNPPNQKTRSHLVAHLSDDDGQSWHGGLMIDERAGVSYPDGVQAPDGTIYLIYDFERTGQKRILLATFTEQDVAAGQWQSKQARQRVVVNQATGKKQKHTAAVIVYGATPAGICAAIGAAREGASVALVEPSQRIGGVNTGGLCFSDSNQMQRDALRGLFEEFHQRIEDDYQSRGVRLNYSVAKKDNKPWTYEPYVAERVAWAMLKEAKVDVFTGQRLKSVDKQGPTLKAMHTSDGGSFVGKAFVDATYEGDLMAAAKVSWVVGREGRDEFSESLAGKQYPKPAMAISGLDSAGQPLPLLTGTDAGADAAGDRNVMTYSFRLCLTANPDNRIPFHKPAHYDATRFEAVRRYLTQASNPPVLWDLYPLPGDKFDANNGIGKQFSMGLISGGNAWCEASAEERQRIWEAHKQYTLELYRFLTTDPAVPPALRDKLAAYGLCKDEFAEYGHWSPQLYVREGRRMRGEYVMRQADILTDGSKPDSIGVASFPIDSHDCQRIARGTSAVINEGTIFPVHAPGTKHGPVYQLPYRCIIPQRRECTNLLVPVALSATHVAYCSLRVEPAWMVVGQSAGIAAAIAAKQQQSVHEVAYAQLKARLLAQRQVVDMPARP